MAGETLFVLFVLGAFSLFGGVLGWATWEDARRRRKLAARAGR